MSCETTDRAARRTSHADRHAARDPISIQRTFAPGSEWVFAKLYASASTADRLLSEMIGPVSRALLSKGLIDRWFFIRYADPDEHLRWRLHAAGKTRAATIQRRIERAVAKALGDGLVRRLVFDTYEREIERYGGEAGIDAAERYFWADSEAIVQLLDPVNGIGANSDLRWQAAIPGIDTLLSDFGFDLDAKLRLMQKLREIFGREFHADAPFARQLAAKYRARQARPAASARRTDVRRVDDRGLTPFARPLDRAHGRRSPALRAAEQCGIAGRSDRGARGELRSHASQSAVQSGTARARAGGLRLLLVPV